MLAHRYPSHVYNAYNNNKSIQKPPLLDTAKYIRMFVIYTCIVFFPSSLLHLFFTSSPLLFGDCWLYGWSIASTVFHYLSTMHNVLYDYSCSIFFVYLQSNIILKSSFIVSCQSVLGSIKPVYYLCMDL